MGVLGNVELGGNVKTQQVEVCFDPDTKQQFLSFSFALHVPLPQLLQQLVVFQSAAGRPDAAQPEDPAEQPCEPHSALSPSSRLPLAPFMSQSHSALMQVMPPLSALAPAAPTLAPPLPPVMPSPAPTLPPLEPGHGHTYTLPPGPTAIQIHSGGASGASSPNVRIMESLRAGDVAGVRLAIRQSADVNSSEGPPHFRTPLHHAMESCASIHALNLLLVARGNVNASTGAGTTPLHLAIKHYRQTPPLIISMLLCAQADLTLADTRGTTPLDWAKTVAIESCQNPNAQAGPSTANTQIRQLLNELTHRPTVLVSEIDSAEIKNAAFADTVNEKIVFHTESAVGLYSLRQRRVTFLKKLRATHVQSRVQSVSVNPALGTIAACLEVVETQQGEVSAVQNVSIIWPNGQIEDEEPLKLSIQLSPQAIAARERDGTRLPACVCLSRQSGPQMLLSRLCDGQVYCWNLNPGRSQLMNETKLMDNGGIVAITDDGFWVAAVSGGGHVDMWCYASGLAQNPRFVGSVPRRPSTLALVGRGDNAQCLMAVTEAPLAGQPSAPIEVLSIGRDSSTAVVHRVQPEFLCHSLSFCIGSTDFLVSAHVDGVVVIYDLSSGALSISHGSPGARCVCISNDRALFVTTEANYLRVFRAPTR